MKPVLFLIAIFCALTACSSTRSMGDQPVHSISNVDSGKLKIAYSTNLETLSLIFNLSEAGDLLFTKHAEDRAVLARALTKKFEAFKTHEAVTKLNFLLNNDFIDIYDIGLALYCTDLPAYEQYADYPSIYYEHDSLQPSEVQAIFTDFHASVRKFYVDAKLEDFFKKEQKGLYKKLMAEVDLAAPKPQYLELMEEYYGISRRSYAIIVSAFAFNGIGKSQTIYTENGIDIYQVVTSDPNAESETCALDQLDQFTFGYSNKAYFREISTHELAHSFFHASFRENPTIQAAVDDLEYLFNEGLEQSMRKQGYTDWRMCFEEHLVRAGELTIAEKLGDDDFVQNYYQECIEQRGFIYLDVLMETLKEYEMNRDMYPTIDDFLPDLIDKIRVKLPIQD